MNRITRFAITVAVASIATLITGCGSQPAPPLTPPPVSTNNLYGSCVVNLIPAAGQPGVSTIGFTATNIRIDTTGLGGAQIIGGTIPQQDNVPETYKPALLNGGKVIGTVSVSAGSAVGVGQYVGRGPDGEFYMNIGSSGAGGSNSTGVTLNATGTIVISSGKLATIPGYSTLMQPLQPGMTPMPTMVGQSRLCANSAAFSLLLKPYSPFEIDFGRVYVYLTDAAIGNYPLNGGMFTPTTGGAQGHGTYLQFYRQQ